nr:rod shape-determining protein MreD [Nonlabens ulvanivorans]
MNSALLSNIVRFIALLLLQVFVMDQVEFMGYISPLVYLLFIMLYPVDNNRWSFLILSFLLGLIIDTFQDTGGAHAAASLTLAFVRPVLLKLVYGEGYLTKNLKILKSPLDRFFYYLL